MKPLSKWFTLLVGLLLTGCLSRASSTPTFETEPVSPFLHDAQTDQVSSEQWYHAFHVMLDKSEGPAVTEVFTFNVRATSAWLTVKNHGLNAVRFNINGYTYEVDAMAEQFTLVVDPVIAYGMNNLTLTYAGRPGTSGSVIVHAPVFTARILYVTELHCHMGRLPRISAYVQRAKAEGGSVFLVNGGDALMSLEATDRCQQAQGRPMIDALNAMGTDVMAVGNRELAYSLEEVQARRGESNFEWLSANLDAVLPLEAIQPFKLYTAPLGQRIAFVGLTTTRPDATMNLALGLQDPVASALQVAGQLKDKVNLIVIVGHVEYPMLQQIAWRAPGVSLILGGDDHLHFDPPKVINQVPIIQMGTDGEYLGDVVLRQAEAVSWSGGASDRTPIVAVDRLTEEDPAMGVIIGRWKE